MERPLLIGLVRVSTEKQADSGLGLDAQLAAIETHRARNDGELLETYEEVESGTHADIADRPRLVAAVEHALEVDGTLVIAKLDRLVRSTSVMQYLKDTKVKFVACDNPHANELTIDILVAVAANEARMISTRTRDALAAYKAGGKVSRRIQLLYPNGVPESIVEATAGKLGGSLPQCDTLTPVARARGQARSVAARQAKALKSAEVIARLVRAWRDAEPELSLGQIARRLNEKRRKTPRGKSWTATQVKRALDRAAATAAAVELPDRTAIRRTA
jgi:DNA invertase Pin-like site-specific DNA recombinase